MRAQRGLSGLSDDTVSSPTLRKHSQADDIIYGAGGGADTGTTSRDNLSPQRFFKRSTWSRNSDHRLNAMSQHPYASVPSSVSIVSPSSTPAPGRPLTDVLLEHQPYLLELATRAPFLAAAGTGNLSKALLSKWLSQDRLYAQAYIGFIGALIARVDLPYAHVEDKQSSLRWRIVNMLSSLLENMNHELKLFENVAKRYGLNLEFPPRPDVYFTADMATKQYIDLFRAFWTDPTMTLLEGLVVLWASKYCHFNAWRYAASHLNPRRRDDLDGGALRNEFIPNWTSDEFAKFVDEITVCTNLLAEREEAGRKIEVLKEVWMHVLSIERKFWPEM